MPVKTKYIIEIVEQFISIHNFIFATLDIFLITAKSLAGFLGLFSSAGCTYLYYNITTDKQKLIPRSFSRGREKDRTIQPAFPFFTG